MKAQMSRNGPSRCALLSILLAGCSSGSAGVFQPSPDAGQGGDDSGGGQDAQGGDDSSPASEAGGGGVPLPFYVSDQFVPTGFMGDSMASMSAITLAHDTTTCKSPRNPGAGGDCFTATWAPQIAGPSPAWAGVYWQAPANNWGALPGKAIAPGATKVSFYAAGAVGGETIQLCAGGINYNASSSMLPYSDTFQAKPPAITLTTSWTAYSIPIQGAQYTTVLGGFCWVASAAATESITFYIDDIQWE
jgi:hypothetical protein